MSTSDTTSAASSSYLIVGSGVFGASAALALARKVKGPASSITLVDRQFPNQHGSASWDWTKVARADYADPLYMRLALEAKVLWRGGHRHKSNEVLVGAQSPPSPTADLSEREIWDLYGRFYHETGLIWVDDDPDFGRTVIENYAAMERANGDNGFEREKCGMVPVVELRERYARLFAQADFRGHKDVFVNENSGWVEAGKALMAVVAAAESAGVRLVRADVSVLLLDEAGRCTGIRTARGETLLAERVILATGAETAALLARSAPANPRVHAGHRLSAAGLITGMIKLNPDDAAVRRSAPTFLHAGGLGQGAVIPPNMDNELKISCDRSFTNTTELCPGVLGSTPPVDGSSIYSALANEMTSEMMEVYRSILGEPQQHINFEGSRICWDAITPTQDFLISEHPECPNLFLATGGSFHAWKFLPTLGEYIVQLLEGTLPSELAGRWHWNRSVVGGGKNEQKRMVPSRDLKDLMGINR